MRSGEKFVNFYCDQKLSFVEPLLEISFQNKCSQTCLCITYRKKQCWNIKTK